MLKSEIFFCAGTFARVCLCRDRSSREYFALKILAIHDVIRLKQIEHVKNEKSILKVVSDIPQHPKYITKMRKNVKENIATGETS